MDAEHQIKANPKLRKSRREPGGWKSMPYILGNETFERLASMGLLANFMVYLRKVYHMDQVSATSLMGLWTGVTNFLPLLGAFLSDAYAGRYWTIAVASFFSFLGMTSMTLTAWLPQLHPPTCSGANCEGPTASQLGFLVMSLCLVSIGSAGIRPCSIPFGVDQFDPTTDKGRKGIASFYNWYYATFSVVLVFTLTIVVYIQDSVSWVLGYGIPTVLMFCSIVLFFMGTHVYVFIKPEGSIFTGLAQVAVAAYKKRHLELPSLDDRTAFYDPPLEPGSVVLSKLPLTNQFSFLNKAAIVVEKELNPDGTRINKWNLSSIQQVEELKCLVRVGPIWVTGILSLTPIIQQATFSISQALQMDRHMGPNFQMPPASIIVISFLTITFFIPLYDQFLVPAFRKFTHHPNGITELQRMAVGIIFAVLSMIVAGIVEKERRNRANGPNGGSIMSVFWLTPQFFLMGLCEAFNIIGQIEFFNKEFPEHMRTMGNAFSSCSIALSSYVNTAMVLIVHRTTGSGGAHGKPDWLANDLNKGRLDYFYYVVAATAFFNFFFFIYCAKNYHYKGKVSDSQQDLELVIASDKKLDV
ncbi:protein NRT1/ PTR FAMILY 2.13-like [Cucurbita moschata]|uniref:Protein NRT1/ PTR FAMILY 2.13-like n=1 Tax=Cucurbita moschata TaxID=3662 RepID=A0A6J1GZR8_CUCMO|nr:protein NRT1/ PTR FAMILY 2.13-like [Cucurbita moschata]